MPPLLALILCSILVIVLLFIERKRNSEASLALWVPTIWMLIYASRPLAHWFEYYTISSDIEAGSPLDRLVLTTLIVLALIILFKRKIEWSRISKDNYWLIIIYLYMGISILWSDIPFVSFKRWFRSIGDILIALVIFSERMPLQAMESVFRRCAYVLIPYSLVLIKYYPHLGVEYGRWSGGQMWTGVTLQKNSLGQLCALSMFLLIWALLREWRAGILFKNGNQTFADVFVLAIAGFLLRGPENASSATSVGILVVGVVGLFLLYRRENLAKFIAKHLKVISASLTLMSFLFYDSVIKLIAPIFGRDETLTSRTEIWQPLIEYAAQNPIFGVGYGGFWGIEGSEEVASNYVMAQAHNGYLAVYLELGIVGLVLLAIFLLAFCGKIKREISQSFYWGVYGICILPMSLLYNNSETCFMQSSSYLWSMIIILTVVFTSSHIHLTKQNSTKLKS